MARIHFDWRYFFAAYRVQDNSVIFINCVWVGGSGSDIYIHSKFAMKKAAELIGLFLKFIE